MAQIREAEKQDLSQLLEIIAPFYSPGFNWSPELFRTEFHGTKTWVLEKNGQILAFACLRDAVDAWEISVLATRKENHGQGHMETLLKDLIQRLNKERHLWLEVHQNNIPAQKLYEKMGFQQDGTRGGYYKDGSEARLYSRPKAP